MSKVEFLPYARFLAPSVKRMFRLRVCVTVHMCACTYWCVCSHIHVCTCAYVCGYLSVKFSDALLHPYKSVCLSVRLLVRPSVSLSVCDAFIQIKSNQYIWANKWKKRHTRLTISILTSLSDGLSVHWSVISSICPARIREHQWKSTFFSKSYQSITRGYLSVTTHACMNVHIFASPYKLSLVQTQMQLVLLTLMMVLWENKARYMAISCS